MLLSADWFGTNKVEIYTVADAAIASQNLAPKDEIAWAFPVLADPGSGLRILLSDEVIVQLRDDANADAVVAELARREFKIVKEPLPSSPGMYVVRFSNPKVVDMLSATRDLINVPGIAWAQPNFIRELQFYFVPNDTFFSRQHGLQNLGVNGGLNDADVDAPEAWDAKQGNANLVVAIIDSGVDTTHPDLSIFTNPNELGNGRESNGVDNDGNGYKDDYHGWDFQAGFGVGDNDPNPGTSDHAAHGTACAGLAGAIANNGFGTVGSGFACRILPVKIQSDDALTFASDTSIGFAIKYAAQFADVISCSWGVSQSPNIDAAIDYATASGRNGLGCAVFFASGNGASDWDPHTQRIRVSRTGDYKFGFYVQTAGIPNELEDALIDQVRLLKQNGYERSTQPAFWADFEAGASGWTVINSVGAGNDWALNTNPDVQLTGTASTRCYESPRLDLAGQPGQWAELRTPTLSLSGNYILAFAKRTVFTSNAIQGGAQFQVRLLDANNNVVSVLSYVDLAPGGSGQVVGYPANYVNSIAVGACTDFDRRSDYSQFGTQLFCVAPSNGGWNDVATTDTRGYSGRNTGDWEDGDYTMDFGGTSAATPLTAGVAALVLSKNAHRLPSQLKDSLRLGCDKIGGEFYDPISGRNDHYGYGRVNANSSLQDANTPPDTTPPTVTSVVTKWGRGLEVTFTEQMGNGVTTPTNYTISGTGKGTLASNPSSVSWVSGYKYLLEWSGGEMLAGTGNVTITVGAGVKDIAGNAVGTPNSGTANGTRAIYQINCGQRLDEGSYPIYPFESERYWSGAGAPNAPGAVNSIINNDGTPNAVYGSERNVLVATTYPGDIVFTLPGITTGVGHAVRLYFYNNAYSSFVGDVEFDVYINNVLLLANFDLVAAAGPRVGFWREFTNITGLGGTITVRLVPKQTWNQTWGAYYYNATISGIKVTAQ